MEEKTIILLLSLVAGVLGTGIGGVVGVLFKKQNDDVISAVLATASGIMLGVVAFDLLPEAVDFLPYNKAMSTFVILFTFVAGVLCVKIVNVLFDRCFVKKLNKLENNTKSQNAKFNTTNSMVKMLVLHNNADKNVLRKTGLVVLFAIALHNFPEGVAIGSSGAYEVSSGALISLVIALHNIPEGMAISTPLVAGGMSKLKSVVLTIIAGATTVLGAVVGVFVGEINQTTLSVCLSLASGAMASVACFELLPESAILTKKQIPFVSFLCGIVIAFVFISIM